MNKYKVIITETLEKQFEIEADSSEEAKEKVNAEYLSENPDYVLSADNCVGTDMSVEEIPTKTEIIIYQINLDRDEYQVAFERYSSLSMIQDSAKVNSSIYDKVFEGEISAENLEDVYRKFNIDQPEGYKGRCLSVSDVVEVVRSDSIASGFYFCDAIGFKKIDFEPDKTKEVKNKMIKVVYLEPGKLAEIKDIDSSLEGLQETVDGFIETYYPFPEETCIVCNDEGKINGMKLNRGVYDENNKLIDIIAGPCFICDCSGENFDSLDEERLNKYSEQFKYPEEFFRVGGEIHGMKIKPVDDRSRNDIVIG